MAARKIKLNFGFAPIPMRVEKAVEDEKSGAHAICTGTADKPHEPSRVRNKVTCETCAHVETSVFGYTQRGVEQDGKLIVLTTDEITEASGTPIKDGLTLAFPPREKVYADTVPGGSVNYLFPDKGGEEGYVLIRQALQENPDRIGVGVWAPVSVNTLWVIEVVNDRLVMSSRCWPEQLRPAPGILPVEVSEQKVTMAAMVLDTLKTDWDLSEYVNQRKLGTAALIASKAGEAVDITPTGTTAPASGDILAAMQATLDAAKKATVKPVKKAAAKKAPAKKKPATKATELPQTA